MDSKVWFYYDFFNILSEKPLSEDLFVVGYLNKEKRELAKSSNPVVKVTKKGVITKRGTFYPFEEAHDLYLHFLIEVHKPKTLVFTNWEYVKELGENIIIGDLMLNGIILKEMVIDFIPSQKFDLPFIGHSAHFPLSTIILMPFAKYNICIKLAIPEEVKSNIYNSSFTSGRETAKKVQLVQDILRSRA